MDFYQELLNQQAYQAEQEPQLPARSLAEQALALAREQSAETQAISLKPKKDAHKTALLAAILGPLADGGSTMWAMNQSGPHMRVGEGNPIYGDNASAGKVMGVKAIQAALQGLLTHYIGKEHPTAANILGYGTGAINGAIAAKNIHTGLKAREANK